MFEKSIRKFFTVLFMVFVLFFVGCGNNAGNPLLLVKEQADKSYDLSKKKVIDAAMAIYIAENGQHPDSLQDLVDSGLLGHNDIVDHEGNPLPFAPDMDIGDSVMSMSKKCGACGKNVSNNSKVGDTCPHCGVRWGYETTSYAK